MQTRLAEDAWRSVYCASRAHPTPRSRCRSRGWRRSHSLAPPVSGSPACADRAAPFGEHRARRPLRLAEWRRPRADLPALTPKRGRDAPIIREGAEQHSWTSRSTSSSARAHAADGRKRESFSARRLRRVRPNKAAYLHEAALKQTACSRRGARFGVCPAAPRGRLGGGRRARKSKRRPRLGSKA